VEERKILILEPFKEKHIDRIKAASNNAFTIVRLQNGYDEAALINEIKDAEIIIGQPDIRLITDSENNCPKLRLIQMTWAGTDIYTRGETPFPKESVMLANASGTFGMIMSQHVIGMILSLMLGFKLYHDQQQSKIWKRQGPIKSLDHANVLIFGAGDIGGAIAKRLSGFDAHVIGVCRDVTKKREYFDELCTLSEAVSYLPKADVVVGCIPNNKATEGYMDYQKLMSMKEGSVIVNVGRGNFIDCMALDKVLKEGRIWGAGLDVTNPEPLPLDHPLWDNPRCMITPHASGTTFGHLDATEDLLCDIVCENLQRYMDNKEPKTLIDF